ncbi:MAG: class I SAM-dependent methyltransferase, partial [Terriglobia bacterium]
MGKGAPLRWVENRWLGRYLCGRGFEIGALWRRFPVPGRARVWCVDRLPSEQLEQFYRDQVQAPVVRPDLVADAEQLPVAAASLDFIIASHVLEHMAFPLAALRGWYEALTPGGALLLKVPDLRYTFDRRRQRTPLSHLIAEHEHPERFDWRAHYAEWVEKVVGTAPGDSRFEPTLRVLSEGRHSIHFHAWIDEDLREMVDYTRTAWGLRWRAKVFWGAHFYRKET